jgi:hypothetical protein
MPNITLLLVQKHWEQDLYLMLMCHMPIGLFSAAGSGNTAVLLVGARLVTAYDVPHAEQLMRETLSETSTLPRVQKLLIKT